MSDYSVAVEALVAQAKPVVDAALSESRVAAKVIPTMSLPRTARQVTADRVLHNEGTIDQVQTIPLTEIWVRFTVEWQQLETADFAAALSSVSRAAQVYGRLEDRLLFRGEELDAGKLVLSPKGEKLPNGARVQNGYANQALLDDDLTLPWGTADVYEGVAAAYRSLQSRFVGGPYGLVLSSGVNAQSNLRAGNAYPWQRMEALIKNKKHDSSVLPNNVALLIGRSKPNGTDASDTAGDGQTSAPQGPVDIALAVPPEVRSLGEIDPMGRHVLWLYGSLALRLKDNWGVVKIVFSKLKP